MRSSSVTKSGPESATAKDVSARVVKRRTAEEVAPIAGNLVESLRDFGYTLPAALADLIDNSISAGAGTIQVTVEASRPSSHIAVVDDGTGMDRDHLVEAMRLGTHGPLLRRDGSDLGRFGLGMKTASLSQGRRLTVITQTQGSGKPVVRQWDTSHVSRFGWQLLDEASEVGETYVGKIKAAGRGTAVVIEDLDRAGFLQVAESEIGEHLARALEQARVHLSMVFHRFIESGLKIALGHTRLKPWDPFLSTKSTRLAPEQLHLGNQTIEVVPFVLPHHSKLSDEEHDAAAGPNGWNAHQGFYIYRVKRLIVPGTWLNLHLRKEEHFKLARIMVDLPNNMDSEWQLNVVKSHVAAPESLREELSRIAKDVRRQGSEVYRYRGERQAPTGGKSQRYVWKRVDRRAGVRYVVDRSHPLIHALLHQGCEHDPVLARAIELVEQSVPIASMLQEPSRALDGLVLEPGSVAAMAEMVLFAQQFLIRAGYAPAKARAEVLAAEPFASYREVLIERLGWTAQEGSA